MNNTDLQNKHSFINPSEQYIQNTKMSSASLVPNNKKHKQQNEGYLELILGPMFSGKTSTLKKIYDQCIYCNIPVMVISCFISSDRTGKIIREDFCSFF